jgi:hypothetical protein
MVEDVRRRSGSGSTESRLQQLVRLLTVSPPKLRLGYCHGSIIGVIAEPEVQELVLFLFHRRPPLDLQTDLERMSHSDARCSMYQTNNLSCWIVKGRVGGSSIQYRVSSIGWAGGIPHS